MRRAADGLHRSSVWRWRDRSCDDFRTLLAGNNGPGPHRGARNPGYRQRDMEPRCPHIQILEGPDEDPSRSSRSRRITSFDDEVIAHLMSTHPRSGAGLPGGFHDRLSWQGDRAGRRHEGRAHVPSEPGPHLPVVRRVLSVRFSVRWIGPPPFISGVKITSSVSAANESHEVRTAIAPFSALEPQSRVIDGLDGLSAKTGWRCIAEDACMFHKDAQPFVSARHHIKIRVGMGKEPPVPPNRRSHCGIDLGAGALDQDADQGLTRRARRGDTG